jgi:hypothetical protein
MADLTPFDGQDITAISIIVRNTGDGLSKAVDVDPVEHHVGETGYIVFEYEVDKIRFDRIKDTDDLRRIEILRAGDATWISGDIVGEALDRQRKRIEEHKGIQRLPLDDDQGDGDDEPLNEAEQRVAEMWGEDE